MLDGPEPEHAATLSLFSSYSSPARDAAAMHISIRFFNIRNGARYGQAATM